MEKIKWKYDSKFKYWYVTETVPYANDGMTISKDSNDEKYALHMDVTTFTPRFKKLSSAKQVANLLRNG